ncbi:hypothetical protein OHS18_24415 [Amycolatopsis sp. NBC_00355]|uniref:hypothetical protein n=1 Tax=Amycolatopsis sp. NBC_00355 TaxID=2975957 RepID=UPI002E2578A4
MTGATVGRPVAAATGVTSLTAKAPAAVAPTAAVASPATTYTAARPTLLDVVMPLSPYG